jgi:type I restriction enzyme S subunit
MTKYRFDQIAANITVRVEPADTDLERYVGLEHLDPESLKLRRWGSPADVIGQKLKFWKGDIIYGKRRAYQRKLAVADFDGICSAHAMVLRAKPDVILPELLPFFLQSEIFHQRAMEISVGSLSPTINWSALAKQEFPLPPVDEQRRIADLLWAADDVIEKKQELLIEAQKLRTGLFYHLTQHGKVNGKKIVFPEKWQKQTISSLGDIVTGATPSTTVKEYFGGDYMFVTPADISDEMYVNQTERYLSLNGLNVVRKLPANSVMVVCIASLGKIAMSVQECATNQQINSIVCNSDNDPKFVYYLMNSMGETLKRYAGASVLPILNKQDFGKITVSVPPLNEQKEIVTLMLNVEETISAIKENLIDSRNLKKQLLASSLGGWHYGQ